MKIAVIGLRGIPNVQGGIETHCQNLYSLVASKSDDIEIVLFRRTRYNASTAGMTEWNGIKLVDINSPHNRFLENIVHSLRAILRAKKMGVDTLHIHAIGPGILAPIARWMGMKVVLTHHGRDYNRKKWGKIAKWALRMGEKIGVKHSNAVISVSKEFTDSIEKSKIKARTTFIPNGFTPHKATDDTEFIEKHGLEKGKYVLGIGRLVEEKGFHDLIEAFKKSSLYSTHKLAIAGDNDFDSPYTRRLLQMADKRVVFTGRASHSEVAQLLHNGALFVLPSYHEGLPIVLLEAMSHGLPLLVSDIEVNRLPEIPADRFFKTGQVDELARKLNSFKALDSRIEYDLTRYQWDRIADDTLRIYRSLQQ